MLPRVLPGLLEQHDDVLHVSWEMGSERFVEEVEMEARNAKRSVEVLDTEERKKKLERYLRDKNLPQLKTFLCIVVVFF